MIAKWLFHLEGEGKGGVEVEVEEKVEEVGVAEVQGVGEGAVQGVGEGGGGGEEEGKEEGEGGGEGATQHRFCIPVTWRGIYVETIVMYITLHMHSGWTMVSSPVIVQPCTFPVGPRIPTSRDPLEMFSHFMDDTFLSNIVRETNRYAAQHTSPHMHSTWETDLEELKAHLGFMIVMGLNHLPEIRDYWSTDPMLHNATRITRDRFEEISRNLHFVDKMSLGTTDCRRFSRLSMP